MNRPIPMLGVALAIGALQLAGCASPYFLVQSRLVEEVRAGGAPDVTKTATYREMHGQLQRIGVRPPDVCADLGAARGSGEERLASGVLRTRCGVEMAELERALVRAGYEVISWSAIDNKAKRENMSPRRASDELGIDALLQINALERTTLTPGRDARWERRFYHSTKQADVGKPASVARPRKQRFEQLIVPHEQHLARRRLAATINASAILVETGATIWFYEWTRLESGAGDPVASVHVYCRDKVCDPVREAEPVADDGPTTGSDVLYSVGAEPADESQAVFHELIREVVTDLVARFAEG